MSESQPPQQPFTRRDFLRAAGAAIGLISTEATIVALLLSKKREAELTSPELLTRNYFGPPRSLKRERGTISYLGVFEVEPDTGALINPSDNQPRNNFPEQNIRGYPLRDKPTYAIAQKLSSGKVQSNPIVQEVSRRLAREHYKGKKYGPRFIELAQVIQTSEIVCQAFDNINLTPRLFLYRDNAIAEIPNPYATEGLNPTTGWVVPEGIFITYEAKDNEVNPVHFYHIDSLEPIRLGNSELYDWATVTRVTAGDNSRIFIFHSQSSPVTADGICFIPVKEKPGFSPKVIIGDSVVNEGSSYMIKTTAPKILGFTPNGQHRLFEMPVEPKPGNFNRAFVITDNGEILATTVKTEDRLETTYLVSPNGQTSQFELGKLGRNFPLRVTQDWSMILGKLYPTSAESVRAGKFSDPATDRETIVFLYTRDRNLSTDPLEDQVYLLQVLHRNAPNQPFSYHEFLVASPSDTPKVQAKNRDINPRLPEEEDALIYSALNLSVKPEGQNVWIGYSSEGEKEGTIGKFMPQTGRFETRFSPLSAPTTQLQA